jgi:hypothetical protein
MRKSITRVSGDVTKLQLFIIYYLYIEMEWASPRKRCRSVMGSDGWRRLCHLAEAHHGGIITANSEDKG